MSYIVDSSPYLGLFPGYSYDLSSYLGLFRLDTPDPSSSSYYGDMQLATPRRKPFPSRPIESRRQIFDRDKLRELIILEKELSIEEEDEIVLLAMAWL